MSKFKNQLVVRLVSSDPERWRLYSPLIYLSDLLGPIIVPVGFETDFASVPRIPVLFFLAGGFAKAPSVIHDFLYSERNNFTREQADAVFLEAMEVDGVSAWRRNGMYQAARLFGASHFVTGKIRE